MGHTRTIFNPSANRRVHTAAQLLAVASFALWMAAFARYLRARHTSLRGNTRLLRGLRIAGVPVEWAEAVLDGALYSAMLGEDGRMYGLEASECYTILLQYYIGTTSGISRLQ